MTSPYTTLWKPGAQHKLLIFGVSSNSYLTVREYDDGSQNPYGPPSDPSSLKTKGIILDTSSITAVTFQGLTRVYGFIATKAKDGSDQTSLYQMSPVWQPVNAATSEITSCAAISTGPNELWWGKEGGKPQREDGYIYYLDKNNKVIEQSLAAKNPEPLDSTAPVHPHTYMAACLDSKGTRYVIYQRDNKFLQLYNVQQKRPITIDDTSGAKESTPLAIVSFNKGDKDILCAYWQNANGNALTRSRSEDGGGSWSSKMVNTGNDKPDGSSLCAVWDAVNSNVLLTYRYNQQDIGCFADSV